MLTKQLGLPGTQLRPSPQDDRIPILLVQRSIASPTSPDEAIHGFTVILPRGWSMYLLNSFAYAGCMIGGLVERRNQYREAGLPSFPEHYGSTCPAGLDWQEVKGKEERERWEKKPPAKRPQFTAVGTDNPWIPDWTLIISGGDVDGDEEMEINMKKEQRRSEPWLFTLPLSEHLEAIIKSSSPPDVLLKLVNAFRKQRSSALLAESLAQELYETALVNVKVEVEGRGSPGDMAIVYALDQSEREKWLRARSMDEQYGRMDWHAGSNEEPKAEMQRVCPL
jgi:ribonuclease P/MRP protein subunit POP1